MSEFWKSDGFAAVPYWLLHRLKADKSATLMVYCAVYKLSDYGTGVSTADWQKINGSTGLSKSAINRALAALREAGGIVQGEGCLFLPKDNPETQNRVAVVGATQNRVTTDPESGQTAPDALTYTESFPEGENQQRNNLSPEEIKTESIRLTNLVRTGKPTITKFTEVQRGIKAALRAGYSSGHIQRAIEQGKVNVWSDRGIEFALSQVPPIPDETSRVSRAPSGENRAAAAAWDEWYGNGSEPRERPEGEPPKTGDGRFYDATGKIYTLDRITANRIYV